MRAADRPAADSRDVLTAMRAGWVGTSARPGHPRPVPPLRRRGSVRYGAVVPANPLLLRLSAQTPKMTFRTATPQQLGRRCSESREHCRGSVAPPSTAASRRCSAGAGQDRHGARGRHPALTSAVAVAASWRAGADIAGAAAVRPGRDSLCAGPVLPGRRPAVT